MIAVDLFAGAGGFTTGAEQAGVKVIRAANHWSLAVEVHKQNHPDVFHDLQDLQQADFYAWPDFDLMLASPACQGHSKARGKEKPHHDPTRSTAWAVVSCAEAKRPSFIVVENVVDYLRWELYDLWTLCLAKLGYVISENVLDAADCGVPQNRLRLFVVGVHKSVSTEPIAVGSAEKKHVPFANVIDHDARSWSPINKPGRSQATLNRIERGRREQGERFLAPYYGKGSGETGRSLNRPIGTITTKDRWALVSGEAMRMLTVREYRACMGFPAQYRLPPVRAQAIHLLGNAVPPGLAKHVITTIREWRHSNARPGVVNSCSTNRPAPYSTGFSRN